MRLLLDQDVYGVTAKFLANRGHDILRVAEIGMATAKDEENLTKASELNRIFITRDRDYGNLVLVRDMQLELYTSECCHQIKKRFTMSWIGFSKFIRSLN